MRLRSVVLPAVVACAAAVAVPSSASAAAAQCSLVLPSTVVINAPTEEVGIRLASDCAANGTDHASWDLFHNSGAGGPLDFEPADIAHRYVSVEWYDDDPMGNWYLRPNGAARADGAPLTQNESVVRVKYASRLTTKVTRSRAGALSWAVTSQQWSGRSSAYVGRAKVNVGLFHRASASSPWRYVKSATTTSTGRATVTMEAPKTGSYRLMVAETPTVWPSYSTPVRGRI